MINTNYDTIFNIVKSVSINLGMDYITDDFTITLDNDEISLKYKNLLQEAVNLCINDLFKSGRYLPLKKASISGIEYSSKEIQGLYEYSLVQIHDMIKIKAVFAGGKELFLTNKFDEIKKDNNTYIETMLSIYTKTYYSKLDIYYFSNSLFADGDLQNPTNEITADKQMVLIDRQLLIYAMCYLYCKNNGLEVSGSFNDYIKRLDFLVSKDYMTLNSIKIN